MSERPDRVGGRRHLPIQLTRENNCECRGGGNELQELTWPAHRQVRMLGATVWIENLSALAEKLEEQAEKAAGRSVSGR